MNFDSRYIHFTCIFLCMLFYDNDLIHLFKLASHGA